MTDGSQPGSYARRSLLRRAVGAGVVVLTAGLARKAVADEARIMIDNFSFSPTPLMVSIGSTVTWVNEDDIPHSILCMALNLKSPALDTDDTFSHRFERVGTYDYICGIHPHMHGQVIVMS